MASSSFETESRLRSQCTVSIPRYKSSHPYLFKSFFSMATHAANPYDHPDISIEYGGSGVFLVPRLAKHSFLPEEDYR